MKYYYYGNYSNTPITSIDNLSVINEADIIVSDRNPKYNENPAKVNTIWINKKTFEWFICINNTPDKNIWVSNKGTIIKYVGDPIIQKQNITEKTIIDISQIPNFNNNAGGLTLLFLGENWKSGNYHFFFQTSNTNTGYLNDAYYGNGFTVRKRCSGFSYRYLSTPPAGDKLLAIFRFDTKGSIIDFVDTNTKNRIYHQKTNIYYCPNFDKICIYDTCDGGYSLGGIIYKLHIYDTYLNDDQIYTAIDRILSE